MENEIIQFSATTCIYSVPKTTNRFDVQYLITTSSSVVTRQVSAVGVITLDLERQCMYEESPEKYMCESMIRSPFFYSLLIYVHFHHRKLKDDICTDLRNYSVSIFYVYSVFASPRMIFY